MSNIVPFDNSKMPAHIAQRFKGGDNVDLSSGVGVGYPVLSYRGKVWHVVEGDNRTLIKNEDGDPRTKIEVVLLKANPNISKVYYPDGWVEGSEAKPVCYSHDGKAPATDASEPQAAKCAVCPHNQWGSRISESGSKGKACSDSRRVAVAPAGELSRPMLLRIPAASLKELAGYADMLNRRGAPYQAVVTTVGFDHDKAHPQFVFKASRWLTDEEAEVVAETCKLDIIENIIGNHNVAGLLPAPAKAEDEIAGTPPKTVAQKRRAEAKVEEAEVAEVVGEEEIPTVATPEKVAATAAKPAAAKPKAKAEAKPKPAEEDDLLAEANASMDEVLALLDDD